MRSFPRTRSKENVWAGITNIIKKRWSKSTAVCGVGGGGGTRLKVRTVRFCERNKETASPEPFTRLLYHVGAERYNEHLLQDGFSSYRWKVESQSKARFVAILSEVELKSTRFVTVVFMLFSSLNSVTQSYSLELWTLGRGCSVFHIRSLTF